MGVEYTGRMQPNEWEAGAPNRAPPVCRYKEARSGGRRNYPPSRDMYISPLGVAGW